MFQGIGDASRHQHRNPHTPLHQRLGEFLRLSFRATDNGTELRTDHQDGPCHAEPRVATYCRQMPYMNKAHRREL